MTSPPICVTCGVQFAPASAPPEACPVCRDARQYVPHTGQAWTNADALRLTHWNAFRRYQPDLYALGTQPAFAIGQRAFLVRTGAGNVLWDCVTLLDDATIDILNALGGVAAMAISHPHYYATMVDWARTFNCKVWLHEADRRWVMRVDPALHFWSGETADLLPGLTLLRTGGHFHGAVVLHWSQGNEGRGTLLSGDSLQVTPDRAHVSFMWSYPNYIPLPAREVARIGEGVARLEFEAVYGSFWKNEITRDGKAAVASSVARYLKVLDTGPPI